ncbi:MAG: TatD family hydrolase [Acidimicrobiales bacterium]
MRWIDNHCHLDPGAEGDAQISEAAAAGVERFIDVGTDSARNHQTIAAAERHPGVVFATVGVHPHDASEGIDGLADHLDHGGVVAVGECGLDYHYDHSPRDIQQHVFAAQIGLAHEAGLPLVIHTREAWEDTFAILDTEGLPKSTVFHCFTGGPAEAEECLARGGWLSFSGIVTFKNADDLRSAVENTPLERLMLETDSPYLSPEPKRGSRNAPANLPLIGNLVAELKGVEPSDLAKQVWDTTHAFYQLPLG